VAGEPAQAYGQRESRKVYSRSGGDQTDPGGISLAPVERAATGEIPIAITPVHYTYIFGQTGAPLDYVRLPKMLGDGNYIALNNKALHSNAGKLFIDYFLDAESMKIMAKLGEFVNRKGIQPPLADADKIQFVPMDKFDAKAYAEKKKEFQKIFLR
jgi:ABC-type Fe3+ transport system substrate-binding protein